MRHSFSIYFYLKRRKLQKDSKSTIMLRIIVNNKAADVSLKMSILQEHWDKQNRRVSNMNPEAHDINAYLDKVSSTLQHHYQQAQLEGAHPINPGGRIFDSTENLYLCAMNNQGLLALAQLILPSEILTNFEVVRVEEEASLIRIYLDESVKAEYKENPEIESKGFCEAVTIRDFPIRDKGVDLIVRRRKWYDKQNNRYFSDSYELKAEGTRYSKEFAAFLKGVYGDDSYDLPFA